MVIGKRDVQIKTEITIGNIASIVTTLLAVCGLIWGGAVALTTLSGKLEAMEREKAKTTDLVTIEQRVMSLERSDQRQEALMAARMKLADDRWQDVQKDRNDVSGRLVGIETTLRFLQQSNARIEGKIDDLKK